MYGLAYPADVPGLSKTPDKEGDGLSGRVLALLHENAVISNGQLADESFRLIRTCSYNLDGNRIEDVSHNWGGDSVHKSLYSYDASGRKIELVTRQGAIHGRTIYSYFDDENRIEALEQVGDETFSCVRSYTAIYDSSGKQIEAGYSGDDGWKSKAFYQYSHDEEGRIIQIATLDVNGIQYHRVAYSYDSAGNLTSEIAYNPNGEAYKKLLFTYDSRGKSREVLAYREDGSLDLNFTETFDDRGNIIEVSGRDTSGKHSYKIRNLFEYDPSGNWIRRTIQNIDPRDGQAITSAVERRKISYY